MSAVGSDRCIIEIGGVPICLLTGDSRFLELARGRYAGFLGSSSAEVELEFDLTALPPRPEDDVRVRRDGSDWLIERGDFRARWNPESGRGHVRQSPNPYALDSVLRILHSLILARRHGFLLHAASGICGDLDPRAYLFSGVSGAGKTTIARLAPADVTLLSDEISYVVPNTDGYLACGTPFSGELGTPGENCSAPVAALFFLEKGRENRIEEIAPAEAAQRLMRNILFFAEDRELVERVFATACDFVQKVPVRRLTFYPDRQVWEEIRHIEVMPAHV